MTPDPGGRGLDMRAALQQGARELGLDLTAQQLDRLLDYQALLQKWGKVYNLTAVRDPQAVLAQHLLDSLAVVMPLRHYLEQRTLASDARLSGAGPAALDLQPTPPRSDRLLDVGSGAGLPGVVVAICCPEIRVSCVDAVAKKAAFIRQVAVSLRLPNLQALHARVESLREEYEVITSRAFASLADFTRLSSASLAPQGRWLAMKGQNPIDEIAALPPEVRVFHVEPLRVPGLDAQRCLVWMGRSQAP